MQRETIAIIPLRNSSKGLPGKNTKLLCGVPLYTYSVNEACVSSVSKILISTDIAEVLSASFPQNVHVFRRQAELATDTATMDDVLLDLLLKEQLTTETIVLLQATSPLRQAWHIDEALRMFHECDYELVLSVSRQDSTILKYGLLQKGYFKPLSNPEYIFLNRQGLPKVYAPNGAIYIFNAKWFLTNRSFVTESIGAYLMDKDYSYDIDRDADFSACAIRILKRKINNDLFTE